MSSEKSVRTIFIGALITFLFGVLTFLLQQHFKTRELENESATQARRERLTALQEFSKACSDLAGAASEMERETGFYLANRDDVPAQTAIDALKKFQDKLVVLQGVGSAAAPLFNLQFNECAPPAKEPGLEGSVAAAVARARCEVSSCNQLLNDMSSGVRPN